MKYRFCPHCGEKLVPRLIGDEGEVPFCIPCNRPLFDSFYTCIITLVVNEQNERSEFALIKQSYVTTEHFICVAGYIKGGEDAESACAREVLEEIGLTASDVHYINSYYYEKNDCLMLGFVTRVKKAEFALSGEVDEARWFSAEQALSVMREGGIAKRLLRDYLTLS